MENAKPKSPISYILILKNEIKRSIRVGALGELSFDSGFFYYTGSAKTGLNRILRHFRKEKQKRWHIDYISPVFKVIGAVVVPVDECVLAEMLLGQKFEYVSRFGCSDCQCPSHLFYSPNLTLDFLSA